jgi:hypothetical protein
MLLSESEDRAFCEVLSRDDGKLLDYVVRIGACSTDQAARTGCIAPRRYKQKRWFMGGPACSSGSTDRLPVGLPSLSSTGTLSIKPGLRASDCCKLQAASRTSP